MRDQLTIQELADLARQNDPVRFINGHDGAYAKLQLQDCSIMVVMYKTGRTPQLVGYFRTWAAATLAAKNRLGLLY